jgi:hypothetical protein
MTKNKKKHPCFVFFIKRKTRFLSTPMLGGGAAPIDQSPPRVAFNVTAGCSHSHGGLKHSTKKDPSLLVFCFY